MEVVEGGKITAIYTVSREPGENHVRDGLEVVEKVFKPNCTRVVGYDFEG